MNDILARSRAPLSLLLAVTLAASPVLSWYAYAEESAEVQEVLAGEPRGDEDDRGAGTPNEPGEGAAQSGHDSKVGEGAAEGEAESEAVQEVPSSVVPGPGGNPYSGLDGAPENAYSGGSGLPGLAVPGPDSSGVGVYHVQKEESKFFGVRSGNTASFATGESISYASDADSAGSGYSSDYERSEGAAEDSSQDNEGFLAADVVQPRAITYSVLDTLIASAWSGTGTQFVIGSNKISARNGTIIWAVLAAADILESISATSDYISKQISAVDSDLLGALQYIQAQIKAVDGANIDRDNSLLSLLKNQWGYGYGGTVVRKVNSPAWHLKEIYDEVIYRTDQLKAIDNTIRTVVTEKVGYISEQLKTIHSSDLYRQEQLKSIGGYIVTNGNLLSSGLQHIQDRFNEVDYISEQIKAIGSLMPSGSVVSYISDQIKAIGGYITSNGNLSSKGFADILAKMDDLHFSFDGDIPVDMSGVESRLTDIWLELSSDTGISRLLSAWASSWEQTDRVLIEMISRWDVQDRLLVEWAKRWEATDLKFQGVLDKIGSGVTIDTGYIEAKLDTIVDLMKIGAAKDVVDSIVGDFDNLASAALMGEVQAAAQNAFPFCIPAVVKQVFGLVEADPAPPVFDFDIWGYQMHVDCAPMQGFADVLGWACRLLLVFACLVSSRRFIYTGVASS